MLVLLVVIGVGVVVVVVVVVTVVVVVVVVVVVRVVVGVVVVVVVVVIVGGVEAGVAGTRSVSPHSKIIALNFHFGNKQHVYWASTRENGWFKTTSNSSTRSCTCVHAKPQFRQHVLAICFQV